MNTAIRSRIADPIYSCASALLDAARSQILAWDLTDEGEEDSLLIGLFFAVLFALVFLAIGRWFQRVHSRIFYGVGTEEDVERRREAAYRKEQRRKKQQDSNRKKHGSRGAASSADTSRLPPFGPIPMVMRRRSSLGRSASSTSSRSSSTRTASSSRSSMGDEKHRGPGNPTRRGVKQRGGYSMQELWTAAAQLTAEEDAQRRAAGLNLEAEVEAGEDDVAALSALLRDAKVEDEREGRINITE